MKILHAIVKDENVSTIVPVDIKNNIWENGEWVVSEEHAKELKNGGAIMLHSKQCEPSRHGGRIIDYRLTRTVTRATKDGGTAEYPLYTFTYIADKEFTDKKYSGTWGRNMVIETVN